MPDLSQAYLDVLAQPRFGFLEWDADQMPPHYGGYSILNLPTSIAQALGAPPIGVAPPLHEDLRRAWGSDVRRIVLFLVDGMGWSLFQAARERGILAPWLTPATRAGALAVLTSIAPSTTAAALTTLWTGRSAAEHGITGYEMWLKEYGLIANMILHSPAFYKSGGSGGLRHAGFDPKTFLPHIPLGVHFKPHGVQAYAFQHFLIANSGLSSMLFQETEVKAFATLADLWIALADFLNAPSEERQFIWLYWGGIDGFSHRYGPRDPRVFAELETVIWTWERFFHARLTPEARRGTLFLVTADHGQIATPPNPDYEVQHHPRLLRTLYLPPTGENRLIYLYPRPGRVTSMKTYFTEAWPERFRLVPAWEVINRRLFGPGRPHPSLRDRIGDWVAIPRGDAYLWWSSDPNDMQGRHAGFHRDEMLVPFLAWRLDA
ncbi:MAG: alkaline phosphatase family protein [Chloroflexi bacterium]|nr:alkaline phosphatase family protein [Chloroflexota bacterium]